MLVPSVNKLYETAPPSCLNKVTSASIKKQDAKLENLIKTGVRKPVGDVTVATSIIFICNRLWSLACFVRVRRAKRIT